MDEEKRTFPILIILRLVLVSLAIGAAIFFMPGEAFYSPFLQAFLLTVYVLSALYIVLWRYARPALAYNVQFYADLVLLSLLLYVTGGIRSLFTPLYVLIIVYSSLLRQREGGLLALTLCIISYTGIIHLGYFGWLPAETEIADYRNLIFQIAVNVLAFAAVAVLGIQLSQRLRLAHRELGVTRGSLAALTALHKNIVESIRSGLVTLDRQGNISSFNRAAQEISGYRQDEVVSQPLSRILPSRILEKILQADFEANPRALRVECWVKDRHERSLFLGMSCSPLLSENSEKMGYVVSLQDLTEIKELEEEIQLKDKMAAIGQLAAGLAHEIRNPLASMSGSIQILRSELKPSGEKSRLLEIALRESERLNKIVEDFLIYAGAQPAALQQPMDLHSLVQDTLVLFKNNPDFKENHQIEFRSHPAPVRCLGNPDQLRQVIWNVLQNSLRAMPGGGKLSIEVRRQDTRTLMSFKDEGVGMSVEERRKLFQPFQSGFQKGVGLGMAIVYQIIQQHHGRIDVRSRPGQGTVVNIWVPAAL